MVKPLVAAAAFAALNWACSSDPTAAGATAPIEGGPLAVRSSFPVPDEPSALALADVDADGDLDAVVGGGSVTILLGDGKGGFEPAPGSPVTGPRVAADFAFGDFDEDGRLDIAVAEHDRPRFFLLRGTGQGGFEMAPGSPFAVDAKPHLHTIAACDLNGDGHLDVITDSWPESRLVLVEGRGDGSFATPGRKIGVPRVPIGNVRAADMNADGHADLVTPAHESEAVTVLMGDGRGSFRPAPDSPYPSFGGFSRLVLADVDRDGDADVVEAHRSDPSTQYKRDALSILLNDGTGRLAHAPGSPILPLSGGVSGVAVGDVDGDGWPDVVASSERTRSVALFRGGAKGLEPAGLSAAGERPGDVAVGDLDGDGRAEVLVTDSAGGRLLVLAQSR